MYMYTYILLYTIHIHDVFIGLIILYYLHCVIEFWDSAIRTFWAKLVRIDCKLRQMNADCESICLCRNNCCTVTNTL